MTPTFQPVNADIARTGDLKLDARIAAGTAEDGLEVTYGKGTNGLTGTDATFAVIYNIWIQYITVKSGSKKYFTGFGADTVDTGVVGNKLAARTVKRDAANDTNPALNLCTLKTAAVNALDAQLKPTYSKKV
jgi:hypothetical protein